MTTFPKPTKRKSLNLVDYRQVPKQELDGFTFDSKLEGALYVQLKLLVRAGMFSELKVKPNVHLTLSKILMIPDFSVLDLQAQELIFCEAKGLETDVWRIKRRLWKHYGPGRLRVYKGSYKKLYLHEEIVPV